MVRAIAGLAAVAIAAQIGRDHGEVFRKQRCDDVPLGQRLRPAVQQQHRRTTAAFDAVDRRAGGIDAERLEAGKCFTTSPVVASAAMAVLGVVLAMPPAASAKVIASRNVRRSKDPSDEVPSDAVMTCSVVVTIVG